MIGVDVGSQGTCAQLIDQTGKLLGAAYVAHDLSYPRAGWAEQDPRQWVAALARALREVTRDVRSERIDAIAFASQLDGLVAVDHACEPVHPAMIWMDRRADVQCAAAATRIDPARLREISGCNLDASHVAAKIAWLARARTRRARGLPDVPAARRVRRLPGVGRAGDRPLERVLDDAARRPHAHLVERGLQRVRRRPGTAAADPRAEQRARSGRTLAARVGRASRPRR